MFILLAILAWALVIVGSAVVVIFGGISILFSTKSVPSGIQKLKDSFLGKPLGSMLESATGTFSSIVVYIVIPSIMIAISAILIFISIMELVRLKKRQKISKPFVKIFIMLSAIVAILLGNTYLLIFAGLMIISLIMLEALLFDSEALNNYAEERNLVSIYREERKFEREVNKEGKLIGNADSETLRVLKAENINMLDQDENQKINDNSSVQDVNITMPLDNNLGGTTQSAFEAADTVASENISALPTELNYQDIQGPIENPDIINNKKYQKYYSQWKVLKVQLDKFRSECLAKAPSLDEKQKVKLQNKFNERAEKVNKIAKELKLVESFMEKFLDLNNVDNNNMDQTVTPAPAAPQSAIDHATASFGGMPSTAVDPNIENLHQQHSNPVPEFVAPQTTLTQAPGPNNGQEVPQTFVIPTTTVDMSAKKEKEKLFMQAALATAVRMDWDMLNLTSLEENCSLESIYADKGFDVQTISMKIGEEQKVRQTATPVQMEQPKFETTVTAPPSFSEAVDSAMSPQDTQETEMPQTFVIPTTTVDVNAKLEKEKQFMKVALAQAVRMDFDSLNLTALPANSDENTLPSDFGFNVETKTVSSVVPSGNAQEAAPAPAPQMAAPQQNQAPIAPAIPAMAPPIAPAPQMAAPQQNQAPIAPAMAPPIAPAPQMNVESINPTKDSDAKMDQIEKRMQHIESLIEQLAVAKGTAPQMSPQISPVVSNNDDQIRGLREEFAQISNQLQKISEAFTNAPSTEPTSLFGALTRSYKYNSKK